MQLQGKEHLILMMKMEDVPVLPSAVRRMEKRKPLPATTVIMRQETLPRVSTMRVTLPSMSMMPMATRLLLRMQREEESYIHTMT